MRATRTWILSAALCGAALAAPAAAQDKPGSDQPSAAPSTAASVALNRTLEVPAHGFKLRYPET